MIFDIRNLSSVVVLLLLAGASSAIQVVGSAPVSPHALGAPSVMERGGTVGAIDLKNKTILVDGVRYRLSATSVNIHPNPRGVNRKAAVLQVGMQIRFNTSKSNFANQDQVTEIWITKDVATPARR